MTSRLYFSLDISREEYLRYYSGQASVVQVRSHNGLLINFPANAMKPWITHQGVTGNFTIVFDENNKLVELKKLSELT